MIVFRYLYKYFGGKIGGFSNSKQSQLATSEDSDLGSELDCSGLMELDEDSKTVKFTNKSTLASTKCRLHKLWIGMFRR